MTHTSSPETEGRVPTDPQPAPAVQPAATTTTRRVDLERGTGIAPYTAVLWDLDGTISDSAPGILNSLRTVLSSYGLPIPSDSELLKHVGPPIHETFAAYGLDPIEATERYRAIYRASESFIGDAYPGVLQVIRDVHAAGIPQSTATSKPESSARVILESYGVADRFLTITGASDDEVRSAKADVIEEALRRLDVAGVDLSNVLMIGDRFYDVEGAAEHGVPAVYVSWGYGRLGEEAGSVAVADSAERLRAFLSLD
ncbi:MULTISPECIES: HAD hydrolase-like protein [unclassified Pseudoclavibacter]|uniref:HAD hydrolase-like protein n=1 Tax=unclassified Pseudoclavibacter TaxID=2615177 RepID=UPI000CE840D3|nr:MULTISPECIES: HAD hydrolase-like protein [unclassified Pseudoclavibacter]PPF35995.1 haloacid dehalogenase [Pseudoclavibacter sp. AY1H1]PPG01545.1 haloacid dehalogenase [Pseudoclavibacter sp. RFBI5]